MTKEEAIAIAHGFVSQQNQESPLPTDYQWIVAEPTEYDEAWYFDRTFEHRFGRLAEEPLAIGGAPGFLVSKSTRLVSTVSWQDFSELPKREAMRRQTAQLTQDILSAELTLANLRRHLQLSLPELLAFKTRLADSSEVEQRALLFGQLYKQALEEAKIKTMA
ncbi:hypothetical protein [Hymenobacter sp. BT190]|uniref:hypothetical protein n=1 Tax=Hymenobacter sp. BT190 TaxID=2763505 RepID=UPI0016510B36|nr:hypothetical protein [Hymenobacter sp. BT190]MBC6697724.1 hypothetical protein [Hymenobacter sp. BT190]